MRVAFVTIGQSPRGDVMPDIVAAHASPYAADPLPALQAAGASLAGTDRIAAHCVGYTEAMRQEVMRASGRPVLLARRLVAHAIDLLLT